MEIIDAETWKKNSIEIERECENEFSLVGVLLHKKRVQWGRVSGSFCPCRVCSFSIFHRMETGKGEEGVEKGKREREREEKACVCVKGRELELLKVCFLEGVKWNSSTQPTSENSNARRSNKIDARRSNTHGRPVLNSKKRRGFSKFSLHKL